MNLLSTIGAYLAQGLSHAEVAVKLEAEHAVTVSEEWVKKIAGADGFGLVAAQAVADAKDAAIEAGDTVEAVAEKILPENNVGGEVK